MELICPSCDARYQLPEGAITARGRQVSCMNCGHTWHAMPPMPLGDPVQTSPRPPAAAPAPAPAPAAAPAAAAAGPSDPRGIQYQPPAGAPRPGENRTEEVPYSEMGGGMGPVANPAEPRPAPVEAGSEAAPAPGDASRSEQMAEIRQMLAEVQSQERGGAAQGDAERTQIAPQPAAAGDAERARARLQEEREQAERAARQNEHEDEEALETERDFRRRLEQKKDRKKAKPTDVRRLRKKHDRKVNRRQRAAKAGSGAFLTGFLLIAIIAATMFAMYRLEPQIVARMPSAKEPMREYVATMDRLRAGASQTIGDVQKWIGQKLNGGQES